MNKSKPLSILCVHQGNELYGSDIMFVQSIRALRQFFPTARIDVIIPGKGPIEKLISHHADKIIYGPVWVLRKSNIKAFSGITKLLFLPGSATQAIKMMKNYHLVYINTIVIINFLIAALLSRTSCLIHIHEIVSGLPGKVLGRIAQKASTLTICNSHATAKSFGLTNRFNTHVVWNGTDCPSEVFLPDVKAVRPLRILMPGRINSWKGQDILVQALAKMDKITSRHLQVRIVGDVYKGQDHFRENLIHQIDKHDLNDTIKLLGFCQYMDKMYAWADVVIVPSLKPEPFGLVAIEAMSHARPVIASAHGGLKEILIDNLTGWLVPPGDATAIANILNLLIKKREGIKKKGEQARKRALLVFSNSSYRKNIGTLALSLQKSFKGNT
ncbi:MAG: glycosyltransferase family 4 protein [Desulfobacula sp.]|uniref:glycosyltransferase family 4 protein n=2 Tax=Desulfobacula sp. TaxID=2593537 RepID=UPI002A059DA7|nr:glycosyltransferase family 4 protein [Desulfobacula sp.]MBT6748600.1 glycosyltransferase family 4 protein [Desulfobacula sp.]MBT7631649.1 glycosyltransferase family 4 protein [Desulfobacula sp.]